VWCCLRFFTLLNESGAQKMPYYKFLTTSILTATFIIVCCSITPAATFGNFGEISHHADIHSTSKGGDIASLMQETLDFSISKSVLMERLEAVSSQEVTVTRGAKEIAVYKKASPGVVLVITDDGLGSGVLINRDGMIVTNHHVVAGYKKVAVIFKPIVEGEEVTSNDVRSADVLKIDEVSDLALLRVSSVPPQANPLKFGNMHDIAVGSDVHSIGHPTGEAWTYTRGIVSQIRRNYEWVAEDKLKHEANVIQTQTPINPGNSGGPLLSDEAKVMGINSFISQGEGLNFAVSIDSLKHFISQDGNRYASVVSKSTTEASTAGGGKCEASVLGERRNETNNATEVLYDNNCDGKADAYLSLPDDPKKERSLSISTRHNGEIDAVIVDFDNNGKWDESYWDIDGDGKIDLIGYHDNGELDPSRYEKYKG